jgi:hypothetical protein
MKGSRDGTRYIEDEMYALYTAALDYLMALKDRAAAEKDLRNQVAAAYESLVSAKNSAESLLAGVGETRVALDRVIGLNMLGKADFSEVADKQEDYQDIQAEAVEALAAYNGLLIDFNRLTCGAVAGLMAGTGVALDAGEGGISRPDAAQSGDGVLEGGSRMDLPSYYIYSDVADLVFVFGIQLPEGYEPPIDSFELWYGNVQLGLRTPIGRELRHLTLDYGEDSRLTVRLYGGDEYVDECVIDTTVPHDVLNLSGGAQGGRAAAPPVVGSYDLRMYRHDGLNTLEIRLEPAEGLPVASYRLSFGGEGLLDGEPVPVSEPFRYLSLLSVDIADARAELYDASGALIHTVSFDPDSMSLRAVDEGRGGD